MARNHQRSGLRLPSSMVPANTAISRSQRAQRNPGRAVCQARSCPHRGHRNPPDQRKVMRYSRQAASVRKRSSNSNTLLGKSPVGPISMAPQTTCCGHLRQLDTPITSFRDGPIAMGPKYRFQGLTPTRGWAGKWRVMAAPAGLLVTPSRAVGTRQVVTNRSAIRRLLPNRRASCERLEVTGMRFPLA